MASSVIISSLQNILSQKLNTQISSIRFIPVGGGSINETYKIIINENLFFFCKKNSAKKFPSLFIKEKNGLELIAKQKIIRTPEIIICTEIDNYQILILEWIEQGLKTKSFWENFGEQLAALHHVSSLGGDRQTKFGLYEDNYMGVLHQSNTFSENWIDFFIHQRLEPQIKLASDNNLLSKQFIFHFENLYKALPGIFSKEKSSFLHGDLWSGNFLAAKKNQPVLIDPAVYFGHRSMDLAMTTLFGGFEQPFYEAYNYHSPFPENYKLQWEICNLYPLLIHLNLFGSGYLHDIVSIIRRY
ncbi:MAG: fructosamine kinase family protein [Bacteroidetes bacterium]|nr:fructosamine kinase family protein [Bacteroidota bacterium]